ncbi:hypothetical protein TcWFU_003876 [Taenia crassiceps]|uniref:Uncharacterized protein n=1 Tax=Taenia crassiceps TaxID=6207 RepID=A0ABR4QKV0_9CEST
MYGASLISIGNLSTHFVISGLYTGLFSKRGDFGLVRLSRWSAWTGIFNSRQMDPPKKRSQPRPKRSNFKRVDRRVKLDSNRKTDQTNAKKERFVQLMQHQRMTEQSKKAKRQMINAKRQAREEKRTERNKAWRKLTKKGQPIMKERINYMLKELECMQRARMRKLTIGGLSSCQKFEGFLRLASIWLLFEASVYALSPLQLVKDRKVVSGKTSNVPHLVVSRQSSSLSDTSLSPSEFDRMINTNFPQVLTATDDIGFESMRSDATNITSAGLNTLYLQAKSTSTPSLLVEVSLSDSTKKVVNDLERCLQDIGPESGIGISPADFGDYGSIGNTNPTNSSLLAPPPPPPPVSGFNENQCSLNSSLEVEEDGVVEEEAPCQVSVYTTPENRVERQLYSLDGNRRSSFESVYSPPVVSEQVVHEVIHQTTPKATVLLQDDKPEVRPAKEISPPPRVRQKVGGATTPATSVTTSISEIISSPPTETALPFPEKKEQDHKGEKSDEETEISTTRSAATLEKKCVYQSGNQSERSDAKNERSAAIPAVVTVPTASNLRPTTEEKIVPKPRIQNAASRPRRMESEEDYEWAKKVQQIAQWQADVNLAMQGTNSGAFIGSPVEDMVDDEVSDVQRPKPLRRKNLQVTHHQPQRQPTMITSKTFQYQPKPLNGNKLESMQRLLQPQQQQHNNAYEIIRRDDMFSRRFGANQNQMYSPSPRLPTSQSPLPTYSQNGLRYSQTANVRCENATYQVYDSTARNGRHSPPSVQLQPKVSLVVPCPGVVRARPSMHGGEAITSYPRSHLSGYAEALSLATAANNAVAEAFSRRGGCNAKQHHHLHHRQPTAASAVRAAPNYGPLDYRNGRHGNTINFQGADSSVYGPAITGAYMNDPHPHRIKSPVFTSSFHGTGRIRVPIRPIQASKEASPILMPRNVYTRVSSSSKPLRNVVTVVPQSLVDSPSRRSPNSTTPIEPRHPRYYSSMTRSRSVGPTIIPPPADASAYPLVTDLSKGLRSVRTNDGKIASLVQALPPKKFILGRVASNEDICIETETPFAFSIAAKGKQICISKVASADDLQRSSIANAFSSELVNQGKMEEGIPVSLRVTFGSTPCVNSIASKSAVRESSLNKTFRSVLHINMTGGGGSATSSNPQGPLLRAAFHPYQNHLFEVPRLCKRQISPSLSRIYNSKEIIINIFLDVKMNLQSCELTTLQRRESNGLRMPSYRMTH